MEPDASIATAPEFDNSDRFICPILHEVMTDPVYAQDGILYSLTAIDRWVSAHGTSPLTRETIARTYFRPPELVAAYKEYCRTKGLPEPDLQPTTVRYPSERPHTTTGPDIIHIISPGLFPFPALRESLALHAFIQTYVNAMHPDSDTRSEDEDVDTDSGDNF